MMWVGLEKRAMQRDKKAEKKKKTEREVQMARRDGEKGVDLRERRQGRGLESGFGLFEGGGDVTGERRSRVSGERRGAGERLALTLRRSRAGCRRRCSISRSRLRTYRRPSRVLPELHRQRLERVPWRRFARDLRCWMIDRTEGFQRKESQRGDLLVGTVGEE